MQLNRLLVLSAALLFLCAGLTLAQRQRPIRADPQFPSRCDPWDFRTKLEEFDYKHDAVVIKGWTTLQSILTARDGSGRMEAVDFRDVTNSTHAMGIVVGLTDSDKPNVEVKALIDYEEIPALVAGLDAIARADDTVTKMVNFEMRYRTHGDLELTAFRQLRQGVAVALSAGLCDRVTLHLTLEELQRFRGMILEAKSKLEEAR